jgi:2-aminophenol/2-amino-5-chlorophenol 1,6-dioxygenase alpha subunit
MKNKLLIKNAAVKNNSNVLAGFLLPGLPHIYLAADKNKGWKKIKDAFLSVKKEIDALNPDILIVYSTYWPSVIGHQIQAHPNPKWTLVDEQFHALGSIPYEFKVDTEFAETYKELACKNGLHARTVAYDGFPIDTGSVVALKLVNPDNKYPVTIVSSNVYSDRAETIVLGKSAREALNQTDKKAVVISISSLSNRLSDLKDFKEDKINSLKDHEWNQKIIEFLSAGRLEDVSQLSRQIHKEARVQKVNNFKAFWWMAAVMGQNNKYVGNVLAYEPVQGTGAAVVGLTPSPQAARDLEFDEDDPQKYLGERNVLGEIPKHNSFDEVK